MLRHVAVFRWADDTTEDQRNAIRAGLGRLPDLLPVLRAYRFGDDLRLVEGNWHFAVVADFDDESGWRAYRDHPEHRRVIDEHIRPVLAERAAVQYEI